MPGIRDRGDPCLCCTRCSLGFSSSSTRLCPRRWSRHRSLRPVRRRATAPSSAPLAPPPAVPREFRAAWVDADLGSWVSRLAVEARTVARRAARGAERAARSRRLDRAQCGDPARPPRGRRAVSDEVRAMVGASLTGNRVSGPSPSYDPLAFAVAAGARARAAIARVVQSLPRRACRACAGKAGADPRHASNIRIGFGNTERRRGSIPAIRRRASTCSRRFSTSCKRYDVDGIHLDDYFYPYRETRDVHASSEKEARPRHARDRVPRRPIVEALRIGARVHRSRRVAPRQHRRLRASRSTRA